MKSPISAAVRVIAFLAAVGITTLLIYVHTVDREYLGAPAAEMSKGGTPLA
jgi:hypothetical protein